MNEEKVTKTEKKQPISKVLIGTIITLLVLVIILLVVVVKGQGGKVSENEIASKDARGTFVNEENVKEIKEKIQKEEPPRAATYTASMNNEWKFKDGSSESSNAYVANIEDNEFTVYFDVFLAETEELIYSSPYIEVGSKFTKFKLTKDLDAGNYEAVCVYHLVDEDKKELSTVSVGVTIKILN